MSADWKVSTPDDVQAEVLIREAEEFLASQKTETEHDPPNTSVTDKRDRSEWHKTDRRIDKLGSEPELREDEVVCPISHYTYNIEYHKTYGHSPYVEQDPKTGEWRVSW